MIRLAYIGDPVTARAFALAGAHTATPPADGNAVWESLAGARAQADLVVVNGAHADTVQARLEALLRADPVPPVVTLPDFTADAAPERDAVALARRLLGVAL